MPPNLPLERTGARAAVGDRNFPFAPAAQAARSLDGGKWSVGVVSRQNAFDYRRAVFA
jgi:hypothetical protein